MEGISVSDPNLRLTVCFEVKRQLLAHTFTLRTIRHFFLFAARATVSAYLPTKLVAAVPTDRGTTLLHPSITLIIHNLFSPWTI